MSFGSFKEAIEILGKVRETIMHEGQRYAPDGQNHVDVELQLAAVDRCIDTLQLYWEQEEAEFARHYAKLNSEDLVDEKEIN